jgi:hypothetical protein
MPLLTQAQALAALQEVQSLSAAQLDARITSEIGTPMFGVMAALAKAMFDGQDPKLVDRVTHLMVLSYLLRREV